ncbi:hypothetical protein K461DRAFT_131316 [Myriangium duriaei CBS 260.36]|uniref:Uncharacterized protein n=1 Tax=Myriangium duriaei CBS 260.36 TaxID=1168546 RepID=A0A9P4J473_9PEZI|nr:hypothetical protein K461DRAFT_131316 [Myriangium duriaei CBS 260.36]
MRLHSRPVISPCPLCGPHKVLRFHPNPTPSRRSSCVRSLISCVSLLLLPQLFTLFSSHACRVTPTSVAGSLIDRAPSGRLLYLTLRSFHSFNPSGTLRPSLSFSCVCRDFRSLHHQGLFRDHSSTSRPLNGRQPDNHNDDKIPYPSPAPIQPLRARCA